MDLAEIVFMSIIGGIFAFSTIAEGLIKLRNRSKRGSHQEHE